MLPPRSPIRSAARLAFSDGQRGQASVELLGALPAVLLVGALVWQLALAGHTAWLSAHAARAAARAEVVGHNGKEAARSAVPKSLRPGLRFRREASGRVRVRIPVPLLHPRWRGPVSVGAAAFLGERP